MRAGDCLRLELVALEQVPGPFVARVRYSFARAVPGAAARQAVPAPQRPGLVERPAEPTVDTIAPYQSMLLDDALCFGQGSAPGPYDVEVNLLAPGASSPFGVLRTCVVYDDGGLSADDMGCGLMLRGIKRVDGDNAIVFDGDFPGHGPYRAMAFRSRTLDSLIELEVVQTGPHELVIDAPGFSAWSSQPVDLVVLDETRGESTTFGRLLVRRE
jgi:hypothetical protein